MDHEGSLVSLFYYTTVNRKLLTEFLLTYPFPLPLPVAFWYITTLSLLEGKQADGKRQHKDTRRKYPRSLAGQPLHDKKIRLSFR